MEAIEENSGNSTDQAEKKFRMEEYERKWIIPDWERVQQSEDAVKAQTFEFTTGRTTGIHAKWKMGFRFETPLTKFFAYWNLIGTNGFPEKRVQATVVFRILNSDSATDDLCRDTKLFNLGDIKEVGYDFHFNGNYWGRFVNTSGELVFKLELIIMEPEVHRLVEFAMDVFKKAHVEQVCKNFASLLGDEPTADIKIMTSDEKQLLAHEIILKAQCPVFESMFRSDLSENQTRIVNVKDVNAKTMGIVLHLFYGGELLPSWKDLDTIVEFTYAAAKYQMKNVLKFLDDCLGSRDEEDATYTDVQLLDLSQKLDLKNAEKELVERIKRSVAKITSGAEFFALTIGNE